MNIWLISIFEQTPVDNVFSTRFISIAEEALKKGHKIHFFASTFKHNTKNQRFQETKTTEININYKLTFVKSNKYKKNIGLMRLISHYKFGEDLIEILDKDEKPNLILIAFPPIHLSYKVINWAKNNNIPVIIDIIDPWPDIFINAFPKLLKNIAKILFFPLAKKVKYIFNNVDGVTAISNQYLNWAKLNSKIGLKTKCFYPAVDFKSIQLKYKINSNNLIKNNEVITVIYAGSLASSYDIPCILNAARELSRNYSEKIKFKIAGVGPQLPLIIDYIKDYNNLEYLGRLSKEELMKHYFYSDLGLTQHKAGASQSVTYKLFDLLGNGLPILNSLQSEMNDIILKNKVGLFNNPGDYLKLTENIKYFYYNKEILNIYKTNSLKLTSEEGDTNRVYSDMVKFLENTSKR